MYDGYCIDQTHFYSGGTYCIYDSYDIRLCYFADIGIDPSIDKPYNLPKVGRCRLTV